MKRSFHRVILRSPSGLFSNVSFFLHRVNLHKLFLSPHQQNGGNNSIEVFVKGIYETVPIKDLDRCPSQKILHKHLLFLSPSGGNRTFCTLWHDVFVVLGLFWKLVMRLLFTKRIWSPKTSLWTQLISDTVSSISSKMSDFSHVLASLELRVLTATGLFRLLAARLSEGRCHCLTFPDSRTARRWPLSGSAGKAVTAIWWGKWIPVFITELTAHTICSVQKGTGIKTCRNSAVGWKTIQETLIEHSFIKC